MTEDVWRTKAAKQRVQSTQSDQRYRQIVCHSTLRCAFLVLMMYLFTVGSVWADYWAGVEAYEQKDYKTALKEWQPLAESGDPQAQFQLGWLYDNGEGVPHDDKEAVKWYRKAAEQGYASAQYNLGVRHYNGEGIPQDDEEAVK